MTAAERRPVRATLEVARLAAGLCALAVLKHLLPLRILARWMWHRPVAGRRAGSWRQAASRLERARKLVALPDGDCLQRSLLLYRELSRSGLDPTLMVGFRTGPNGLEGHAWVVVADGSRIDTEPDPERFTVALGFGPEGRPLSSLPSPSPAP